ncbi:MAG TPA: hypothetical protein VNS81_06555 [Nocardioides sp.]|nr:hypothetical protein [Nocardioides sp.]
MARRRTVETDTGETRKAPTEEERQGMRAHDENGNVRPADGRWELHEPKDEAKYVKTEGE